MKTGRIFQDNTFTFDTCNGQRLQKCVALINPDNEGVIMVYVQTESDLWFRFFLDSGIGFLECYGAPEQDERLRFVDLMEAYNLHGAMIKQLVCMPDGKNSRIVLQLNGAEQLVLCAAEPDVFDSKSKIMLMHVDK